ncbi:MAG: winged helix-turn-helix transcriptional regulator [Clostridiales bacterium]|nr:winged helix-turn-helix transcriptional regulator [Clostridiales bacterium]
MERSKVSILIKKSSLIFDKYVNQLLVPYHLTGSQFRILMMLYKSPDCSVRQTDIEAAFSMTNPTVTGLVHNLEKNGLVKKITNPEDKRSRFLALTEYAESRRNEFLSLADSIENEMTDGLSETETAVLSELLLKVIKKHEEQ